MSLFISALTAIVGEIMNGFTASVGNLNAVGTKERRKELSIRYFLYLPGCKWILCTGLYLFLNKLIVLWIGEAYFFFRFSGVCHCPSFLCKQCVHFAAYTYRVTMGLFIQGRWASLAAVIINIVLSFWLGSAT